MKHVSFNDMTYILIIENKADIIDKQSLWWTDSDYIFFRQRRTMENMYLNKDEDEDEYECEDIDIFNILDSLDHYTAHLKVSNGTPYTSVCNLFGYNL